MRDFRLLSLVGALVFVGSGITSPVITIYLEALGASFAEISLILTTFTLTALLANYASGWLSDRLGRRKPMLIVGLLLLGLAYWWLASVPNATLAWPVRIVEGIGAGIYATISLAMMGDLLEHSERRGRNMGLFRGIGSASFALGAFAGGWFATRFGASSVFLLAAGCYVAAAACMLPVRDRKPGPAVTSGTHPAAPAGDHVADLAAGTTVPAEGSGTQPTAQPSLEPLGAPSGYGQRGLGLPAVFLLGVVAWTAAIGAAASMWPNAMSHLGYSQQAISSLWGLAALVEFPGMTAAGILSDSVGRAPLLAAGGFGVALVFLGYIFVAQWLPALIGVQVVRGLAYGSYMASAMTYAAEHGSRRTRGSVSGIYSAATGGGQLLGMLASGLIVQAFGFTTLFWLCALAALGGGFCFLSLRGHEKREKQVNQR
jgi:MFS family permease